MNMDSAGDRRAVGRRGCPEMLITLTWLRLDGLRRWRSLAVLALLIALATATVLTSIAGARRGHTAFDRLWARTLPATATVLPNQPGFDWAKVAALPEVAALTKFAVVFGFEAKGYPGGQQRVPAGRRPDDPDHRAAGHAGRAAVNPRRADEVVVTPKFAATSGRRVATRSPWSWPACSRPTRVRRVLRAAAGPKIRAGIVGRGPLPVVSTRHARVAGGILTTPALFTRYRANIMGTNGQAYIDALVRLKGGEAAIPAFRADLARVTGRTTSTSGTTCTDRRSRSHRFRVRGRLPAGLRARGAGRGAVPGRPVHRPVHVGHMADCRCCSPSDDPPAGHRRRLSRALPGRAGRRHAGRRRGHRGLAVDADRPGSIAEPHRGSTRTGWSWAPAGSRPPADPGRVGGRRGGRADAGRRRAPQRRSVAAAWAAAANFPSPWWSGPGSRSSPAAGGPPCPSAPPWWAPSPASWGAGRLHLLRRGLRCGQHPARFGQTWQLDHVLRLQRAGFRPASRVLRAVAADRDVTGVDDARTAARSPARSRSRASPTPRSAASGWPSCSQPGGCPQARTRSCWPRPPPRSCTPGRAPWSGRPAVPQLEGRPGHRHRLRPAGPAQRVRGGRLAHPGGVRPHLPRRALRFSSTSRLCRCGRAQRPGRRAPARRGAAAIPGGKAFTFTPPDPLPEVQEIQDLELLPVALSAFLALLAISAAVTPCPRGPPPGSRPGRASRARDDPAAGAAGGHDPGQPAGPGRPDFGVPLGIALGRVVWRRWPASPRWPTTRRWPSWPCS